MPPPETSADESVPFPRSVRRPILKIGFLRTLDAAPLVVAYERGLFRKYGVEVELVRELGVATLRDRLSYGELHAAQMPAPLPFVMAAGLGGRPSRMVLSAVLTCARPGVVLSQGGKTDQSHSAKGIRDFLLGQSEGKKLLFAVPSLYTSGYIQLRDWLVGAGLKAEKEFQIVALPSEQWCRSLATGEIAGAWMLEPWVSLVRAAAVGELFAMDGWQPRFDLPETVFAAPSGFVDSRKNAFVAMTAAVLEGAAFCGQKENQEELVSLLAREAYLDTDEALLRGGMVAPSGAAFAPVSRLTKGEAVLERLSAFEPGKPFSDALQQALAVSGLGGAGDTDWEAAARGICRSDLFRQAAGMMV